MTVGNGKWEVREPGTEDGRLSDTVGVAARVVAAGVPKQHRDGRRRLQATLVLVPIANPGRHDHRIALSDWPAEIERLIARDGIDVAVSGARSQGNERPAPSRADLDKRVRATRMAHHPLSVPSWPDAGDLPLVGRYGESRQRRPAAPPKGSDLAAVTDLWRRLMGPRLSPDMRIDISSRDDPDPDPWRELVDVLASAGAAATVPQAPLVVVPSSDIALTVALWRARVVLAALGRDCGDPICDPLCDGTPPARPWLVDPTALDRISQRYAGCVQDTAEYKELIARVRAGAEEQMQAVRNVLCASDLRTAVDGIRAFAGEHLKACRAPVSIAEALAADGSPAHRDLVRDLTGLYMASLAPDPQRIGSADQAAPKPPPFDAPALSLSGVAARRLFALQAHPLLGRLFNMVLDVMIDVDPPDAAPPGPGAVRCLAECAGFVEATRFHETDVVDADLADDGDIAAVECRDVRFLFLSSAFGRRDPAAAQGRSPIWTTAKLRLHDAPWRDVGRDAHFWPCARAEIDLAAARGHAGLDDALDLYDGVLNLGVGQGTRQPRYDIVSLDTNCAIESEIQKIRSENSARLTNEKGQRRILDSSPPVLQPDEKGQGCAVAEADRPQADAVEDAKVRAWFANPERRAVMRPTLRTAGLTVVDRWRQCTLTGRRETRQRHRSLCAQTDSAADAIVEDAEDLNLGFRLDVGIHVARAGRHLWRSLTNRTVEFSDPIEPKNRWIDDLLRRIVPDQEERTRLASTQELGGLFVRKTEGGPAGVERLDFGQDVIAVWRGDPLGAPLGVAELYANPGADLAIGQSYGLLGGNRHDAYRPPPLVFGWRYRLGIRAVFVGGGSLPLERAAGRYEREHGGTLALPTPPRSPGSAVVAGPDHETGHRFLRHERIDAPMLAISARNVKARWRGGVDSTRKVPLDPASRMVLRAVEAEHERGFGTTTARRVLFVPVVAQSFATAHRAFDGVPVVSMNGMNRPRDGLVNVRFNAEDGGLPYRGRDDRIVTASVKHEPATPYLSEDRREPLDPVFQVGWEADPTALRRRLPYYPDPGAMAMAVAVRRRPADGTPVRNHHYLDGTVLVLPLYGLGRRYPDAVPIILDLEHDPDESAADPRSNPPGGPERRMRPATQESVVQHDAFADVGVLDGLERFSPRAASDLARWDGGDATVPVRRVRIRLAPGEDFDIDVWCLPGDRNVGDWRERTIGHSDLVRHARVFARTFDLVESAAMLAVIKGGQVSGVDQACAAGLGALTGLAELAVLRDALVQAEAVGIEVALRCGAGGLSLPCRDVIEAVGTEILQRLTKVPVPEVSAVTTIQVTHALQRPLHRPTFDTPAGLDLSGRVAGVHVVRRRLAEWQDVERAILDRQRAGAPDEYLDLSQAGESEQLFLGTVFADVETTGAVDVIARTAGLSGTLLDDPGRRLHVTDPRYRAVMDGPPATRKDAFASLFESVYGFAVDDEGFVTLTPHTVPLLRIDKIQPEEAVPKGRGLRPIDLLRGPHGALRTYALRRPFADTRARRLELSLVAETRFRPLLVDTAGAFLGLNETPDSVDYTEAPLSVEEKLASRVLALEPSEIASVPEKHRSVWVPATWRPARLSPKSLLPSFVWSVERPTAGTSRTLRRTFVRVRMRRPWFSSGEGEQLGIVVWPPDLFELDPRKVSRNKLFDTASGQVQEKSCEPFDDCQLGNGGAFVSRWASDPIRRGPTADGWFMPREVFADAFDASGAVRTSGDGEVVRRVSMPIPRMTEGDFDTQKDLADANRESLKVSLVLYTPRFDWREDVWYVDVELNAFDLPDPFIRLGLVRYQRHAPEALRVSEPAMEFVQILPRRTVETRVGGYDPQRKGYPVEFTIFGPGSVRAGDLMSRGRDDKNLPYPEEDPDDRPRMRAWVLRNERRGDLRLCDVALQSGCVEAYWESDPMTAPQRSADGLRWSHTFVMAEDPRISTNQLDTTLFIEEFERRPSASPDENAGPDGRSRLVESGPRFAVKVPLGTGRI
ncbi:hypothetical protein FZ983_28120 [Azospirillum sp. B21]|uniref:hypothetical protein n=1 Tax=Azospirillum sp. B21 TaxID=2607496 RepID=UPI0011EBEE7E|nr:hypothetical protein [Azospirillum sp. B21]KAA0574401.1 hypothetical protein FZ983_28120 [Azospirillum sp. B21]